MSEFDDAVALANRVLERPYIDPDGDICLLARHLLRSEERASELATLRRRVEPYEWALRWVYKNGVMSSHDRPDWVNQAFSDAFENERLSPPTRKE